MRFVMFKLVGLLGVVAIALVALALLSPNEAVAERPPGLCVCSNAGPCFICHGGIPCKIPCAPDPVTGCAPLYFCTP